MAGYPREGETFGDYEIDRVLGRGGMGVVYAATHTRIKRRVALKVIAPELAGTDEYRVRFLNEAATLVRLDSPHIIQVLDHGEIDGALFIATQLVAGGDLAGSLESGPLAVGRALALAVQITSGVADAHRAGVLHRDIKPSNVLVTGPADAPFAYLCDFGIARDTEPDHGLTVTGAVIGTFPYLAPERFQGAPAATTTDVYALGCLLWAMLTGQPPYGGTQFSMARDHIEAPVRQLVADEPWIADLNAVLAQSMAKDPTRRFTSVDAMRVALDHVLAGVPMGRRDVLVRAASDATVAARVVPAAVVAPPPPPPTPVRTGPVPPTVSGPLPPTTGTPPRRAGWIVAGAALVALAVVLGVTFALRPWADDDGGRRASDDHTAGTAGTTGTTGTGSTTEEGEVGGIETSANPTPQSPTGGAATGGAREPIAVTVVGTCGDGSCYLQVREGTSASAGELVRDGTSVRWRNGSTHQVVCQVHGDKVSSRSVGGSSDVWARTSDGGWVSSLHLNGIDSFDVEVPC
ncbi:MAG TPA: serine/threonine-protein kinase [Nocardioides sp.]|nr:serine/threonine-protein kinase [Nocardioides sp.]